jgi:invasion protein IalB
MDSDAAPATAGAPQPKVLDQKTFGDWIYTCVERTNGEGIRCSITQHLSEANTKTLVFSWRITRTSDGSLAGVWQTPELVLLQAGIAIDVGGPKPFVIPYETCGNGLCRARVRLGDDIIDAFTRAEKAVVSIVGANGQRVNLNISVKGLADGLAVLRAPGQPENAAPQPQ